MSLKRGKPVSYLREAIKNDFDTALSWLAESAMDGIVYAAEMTGWILKKLHGR